MEGVLSFDIFIFLSAYTPAKSFCVQCVFYIHCNFYCVSPLDGVYKPNYWQEKTVILHVPDSAESRQPHSHPLQSCSHATPLQRHSHATLASFPFHSSFIPMPLYHIVMGIQVQFELMFQGCGQLCSQHLLQTESCSKVSSVLTRFSQPERSKDPPSNMKKAKNKLHGNCSMGIKFGKLSHQGVFRVQSIPATVGFCVLVVHSKNRSYKEECLLSTTT